MNINKIGGISGKHSSDNFAKTQKENHTHSDSVNISETARNKISMQKALELVKKTADIRLEKVEKTKVSLQGYFSEGNINSEVTEKIAKKITEDIQKGLI